MTTTTKRDQAIADIIAFFEEHEDIYNDCIEELDRYNGYLGDDRYYYMEDLDDLYSGCPASEVLARAFSGYDESGGEFCPHCKYFKFNGCGNLVSADYRDYSDLLDSYFVEAAADNRRWIDTIDNDPELAALFDALDEDDDEEGNNND